MDIEKKTINIEYIYRYMKERLDDYYKFGTRGNTIDIGIMQYMQLYKFVCDAMHIKNIADNM